MSPSTYPKAKEANLMINSNLTLKTGPLKDPRDAESHPQAGTMLQHSVAFTGREELFTFPMAALLSRGMSWEFSFAFIYMLI